MKSHPLLEFNPGTHVYRLSESKRMVPGVSRILKACNLVPTKIFEKHGTMPALKGDAVHKACALYLEKDLDISELDERIEPYVEAFAHFIIESGFEPESWEEIVFHENLYYAGTYDIIGYLNGEDTIIDIKSGSVPKTTGLQLALYDMASRSQDKVVHYRKRFALQLRADAAYRLKEYKDITDYLVAESLVDVFHWKQRHGLVK